MRRWCSIVVACIAVLTASLAWIPRAEAQANVYYFPASGHFLDDTYGFLSFWQSHGAERVFGFPIAEAHVGAEGLATQYFERGRLEQAVDPANGLVSVRPGQIGTEYAEALWKSFPPAPKRKASPSTRLFESTSHTLRAPFLGFWERNGGEAIFGPPISEAHWELTERGRRMVQYFASARLERDADQIGTDQEIVVGDLGRVMASVHGIETTRQANWGATEYGPAAASSPNVVSLDIPTPAPATPAPPRPTAAPVARSQPASQTGEMAPRRSQPGAASKGKYIVVNLSDQWLYAYEDGEQVLSAPVSTGRDGMETPTGTYAVYTKLKSQTMDGVDNGVPWEVPNVPNVMYIYGGVALHGTYWHNRFGTGARLSHGCVNLPLKSAAWLYDWAPVGTPVKVTY